MRGSNKNTDVIILDSHNSRERDTDEQWITVKDTNIALDQRNSAIKQHCINNIIYELPIFVTFIILLGFS